MITKPVNVYFGAWARANNVSDAIIPYVGMDYGSFNLGISYDVNVSGFKVASQSSGWFRNLTDLYFQKTN